MTLQALKNLDQFMFKMSFSTIMEISAESSSRSFSILTVAIISLSSNSFVFKLARFDCSAFSSFC